MIGRASIKALIHLIALPKLKLEGITIITAFVIRVLSLAEYTL